MEEGKNTAFGELKEIVAALRAENGCPWDRAQTHDSLRPCMLEEAAELLASIRIFHETGNPENMKEELGDVLLQVVMHSQIAAEEGLFTIEDVINGGSEKMVRRHPHVFRGEAWDQGTEPEHWEEIKKKEKESQTWGFLWFISGGDERGRTAVRRNRAERYRIVR